MPQFHETGYGRKFFDYQLPEITRQISRLAKAMENAMPKIEYACEACKRRLVCKHKPDSGVIVIHGGGSSCFEIDDKTAGPQS